MNSLISKIKQSGRFLDQIQENLETQMLKKDLNQNTNSKNSSRLRLIKLKIICQITQLINLTLVNHYKIQVITMDSNLLI